MSIEEKIAIAVETRGFEKLISSFKAISSQAKALESNVRQSSKGILRSLGTNATNNIINQQKEMGRQSKIMEKQLRQTGFERLAKRSDSFAGSLKLSQENFAEINKRGIQFNSLGGRIGNKLRLMTAGLKGFKMEMLGVMFFGMGIKNLFGGLLKPAGDLVGLFELWGTTLQVLFLPVAMSLLEFLMPLFEFLMNLSPEVKMAIGKFVLFGIALGAFLFIIGTLALGIGSLIVAVSGIFNIFDKLIPDVEVAGVNMSSFVEAGLGLTLVKGAAELLSGVVNKLLEAFFGLEFVETLLDKLGFKFDEAKTPLENFKDLAKIVFDKVKENLNFDTEFLNFDKLIEEAKGFVNNFFDDFNTQMEELGVKDFIKEIGKLTIALEGLVPSLKTIAGLVTTISNAFSTAKQRYEVGGISGILMGNVKTNTFTGERPTAPMSVTQNNNINGSIPDIERMLDDKLIDLVDEIKRNAAGN